LHAGEILGVRATWVTLLLMSPRTGNLPQCEQASKDRDPALVPFDTIKIVFVRIEKSRRPEKSRPCFSLAFVRGQQRLFLFSRALSGYMRAFLQWKPGFFSRTRDAPGGMIIYAGMGILNLSGQN